MRALQPECFTIRPGVMRNLSRIPPHQIQWVVLLVSLRVLSSVQCSALDLGRESESD